MVDWDAVLAMAANDVRRRFWGYVDREDLVQEGWLWRLTHNARFLAYDTDEQEKRAEYRLRRDLIMAMEIYARAEMASRLGYDVEDEAYYSEALIAAILPSVLDEDYHAPQAPKGEIRAPSDPAMGGTWMAHFLDVKDAWNHADLTDQERDALCLVFGLGMTVRNAAAEVAVSHVTIERRVHKGLRKMVRALGGSKPRGCPYDCECHDSPLRRRPGVRSEISGKNQEMR